MENISDSLPKNLIFAFIGILLFVVFYNLFLKCYICEGYKNDKKKITYK